MGHGAQASAFVELVDLIGVSRSVGNYTAKTNFVIFCLGLDGLHNPIHRKDGVEIVSRHDQAIVGMLQRGCEPSANHIAEHIENHHIRVFQEVMLFEEFHRLAGHIATAACSGWGATTFNALHTVVASEDEVVGTKLFAVEIDFLKDVNHRGHHRMGEGEGAVVLGVAADL